MNKVSQIYTFFVLIFIFLSFRTLSNSMISFSLPLDIFIIAIIFQLVALIFIPPAWYFIIKQFTNKTPDVLSLYGIYGKSWLGRYVPGKIGWILGRIIYGKKLGISNKMLTISSVIEILITILVLGVFAIPAFVLLSTKVITSILPRNFSIVSIAIILILLFDVICNRDKLFIKKYLKILSQLKNKLKSINYKHIYYAIFSILISSIISFIPFFLIISFFLDLGHIPLWFIYSLYFLSSFLGITLIIAPAGVGVREFVIYFGLLQYSVNSDLITILVYYRLILLISDLLFFFLGLFISFKRKSTILKV